MFTLDRWSGAWGLKRSQFSDQCVFSAGGGAEYNIPAVISKQSGVAEVMKGALKADFWDVNKMAEHIVHLCTDEELYRKVVEQSTEDIKASTWDAAADKVIRVYEHVLNR